MKLYDKIAEYYDRLQIGKAYGEDVQLIRKIAEDYKVSGNTILDIGCGTGTHAKLLTDAGYKVTGIDKSKGMINEAIRKHPRLRFIVKDFTKMNLADEFDLIICMYSVIHYLKNKKGIINSLKKFHSHLKVGGCAIIELGFIKDNFDPELSEIQSFDVLDIKGSIVRDYDRRGDEVLFSYNININDKNKVLKFVETRKAPLLSIKEWVELLKIAGFKKIKEYKNKKPLLVGLKE